MSAETLPVALRELADEHQMMWEVARAAIEDALIEWRDSRMSVIRNNGFVVKSRLMSVAMTTDAVIEREAS